MKKQLMAALALVSLLPALAAAGSYSTDFNATENPVSENNMWTNGKTDGLAWNDVKTVSGIACGAHILDGPRYADCIAHLNTSFAADQWAQGTVYRVPGYSNPSDGHEIELLLRFKITANTARGYEVLWAQNGHLAIVRWNGPLGNYTSLKEGPNIGLAVEGDVLRMEIKGSVITVFKNGTLVATTTNSTWTDGQPGVGYWPLPGSTLESYGWKDFEAGDSVNTAVSAPGAALPGATFCGDPQPNPSNPSTSIRYGLASPGHVTMILHDIRGKAVATLVKGYREAGCYDLILNTNGMPSGVYFVAAKIGAFNKTVKVLLLK
jgi:hypothetical protein